MYQIVDYVSRLEDSNFSEQEQNYQEYLASGMVSIVQELDVKRRQLHIYENLQDNSKRLQDISNRHGGGVGEYLPTTYEVSNYAPGVPPRRSKLDISRDKIRKMQIETLKDEIQLLEEKLRNV